VDRARRRVDLGLPFQCPAAFGQVNEVRAGALAELTREELVTFLVPAIRAVLAPAIAAAQAAGNGERGQSPRRGATTGGASGGGER
jgi:hypothetical protein